MGQVSERAVAAFAAAVDGLLSCDVDSDLHAAAPTELVAVMAAVETQRSRLAAVDARLITALEDAGAAAELATRTTTNLLRDALRLTPGEARARVRAAESTGPRRALTGEPLAPSYAHVAAGQAAGTVSVSQARVIVRAVNTLPNAIAAVHGDAVEAELTGYARTLDADQLAVAARRIHDHLNPDGTLADDEDHRRHRDVRLRQRCDGSGEITGRLTPAALATWRTLLDSLARPRPATTDDKAGAAGKVKRDDRRPGQRMHDAFQDAGLRLLRAGNLPESGGTPVMINVTIGWQQLMSGTGLVTTADGTVMSVAALLAMAGEANLVPVVLNDAGGVMAYGRTRRTASPAQRCALAARDHGCSFPGCDAPPSWCQAHHIIAWLDDGLTDLDNLTLLCGYHHREFARRGWTCRMIDDIPHWIPPDWLDPGQDPRVNTRILLAAHPSGQPINEQDRYEFVGGPSR